MSERNEVLGRALQLITDYLDETRAGEGPVVRYLEPGALAETVDLSLGPEGVSCEELLEHIATYLTYCVRTTHLQFHNQLWGGFSLPGFLGDVFTGLANTSMYTYEVAPLATLMELELVGKMCSLVGFDGGEGIFCPGGSNANLLGMLCARNRAFPEVQRRGFVNGERPVLFVSADAHYSFEKAANQLGLGIDNVVKVATDERGRMIPGELERAIQARRRQGEQPFFVGATAGTTVRGAFDPLPAIADVAAAHGLWLHVDGAWGGPVLLSRHHRHLLDGCERADSFAWDAHKMMGASLTCTAFLTSHRGILYRTASISSEDPEYLFHDTSDADYDLGKRSQQCGRRVDALKLWLMWKHCGDRGLEARVDRLFELARYATDRVEADDDLELRAPLESLNLCFRYRPPDGSDPDAFNRLLRERMRQSGRALVNYSQLGEEVVLRLVFADADRTEADLDRFFALLAETATALAEERTTAKV